MPRSSSCAKGSSWTTNSSTGSGQHPRAVLPRHVPNEVFQIAVPRTLSGKVLEVPVKRILMGDPEKAASRDSLANPAAFDYFTELAGRL